MACLLGIQNTLMPLQEPTLCQNLVCGRGASWCSEVASCCHVAIPSLSELANRPNKSTITFSKLYHGSSWAKTLCCHGLPPSKLIITIWHAAVVHHGVARWLPLPCCYLKLVRAGKWPKQMNNNIQQAVPRFFVGQNTLLPWVTTPKTQNLECGCGASWCSEVASCCHLASSGLSELANGPNQ